MTEFVLVVLLLAAVAAVVVLVLRQRRARRPAARRTDPLAGQPDTWDPMRIGPGDVITYAGIDHVVRGTITLTEAGVSWYEHLLDGSTGRRWLTVEDDEGDLELTLWQRAEGTGLTPDGDVVLRDVVHRQVERGRAQYRAEGTTGTAPSGTVDYADYRTRDGLGLLAFERWADTQSWEVSTGRRVTPAELTVYHAQPGQPGS
ncbi:DUF4178 domain-containing protein [Klenkia taihuensis]|uniref:DUF4178 domain-containing protein n=1 Tax=Klenkia taihuensis TaxID=1225127 RepID=A0A1I1QD95_9ACTN|nr:DUF4178 domain-containing protein [Klenkia taihuensis]GHE07925.1 hypothetical protein GCM10011381_06500 [Klenkia taihuensis]SFD19952.1 protein of unknown function [Klenkia taihuensis]